MEFKDRIEQHIYYSTTGYEGTIKDQLIEYCSRILDDRIISSQKHKWACQRFLYDLDKEVKGESTFKFVEEEAEKAISWLEEFKHRKGVLAGTKIKAHIFLKFVLGNIYGWIDTETGYRRFKRMYEQVGRKNAKSQLLGGMCSYELSAYHVQGSEVFCLGPKSKQAKAVFNETAEMIEGHKYLNKKIKIKRSTNEIFHKKSNSVMTIFTKDDLRKGDSYNPQFACIDEYHLFDTSEPVDVMESGMGARYNPLRAIITTAGRQIFCPCKEEYDHCSKILSPYVKIYDDKYFIIICEMDEGDDPFDIINVIKANPIVSTYKEGLRDLMDKLETAKSRSDKRIEFFTKQCNKWVNQKESKPYMDMEKWDKAEKKIPNLEGKKCVIGLDRSDKIDLTSLSYEFDMGDNNVFFLNHCFLPEDTLEDKMLTDKVPYDLWALEGHITKIPGAKIKNSYIKEHILMMKNKYNFDLDSVAYDPWHCDDIVEDLEEEGILCIEIPQTFASLSEPTKDLRAKTYSGEVSHDGNPVLNYCMSNAVEDTDRKGNLKLWKEKKDSERIDAAITSVISHVRMSAILKGSADLFYSPT